MRVRALRLEVLFYFFILYLILFFILFYHFVIGKLKLGEGGHCPEDGVSQQTALSTSRSWYLDSVWAGEAGRPLLIQACQVIMGEEFRRCCRVPLHQRYRQLRVMLSICGKSRERGWAGVRLKNGY